MLTAAFTGANHALETIAVLSVIVQAAGEFGCDVKVGVGRTRGRCKFGRKSRYIFKMVGEALPIGFGVQRR